MFFTFSFGFIIGYQSILLIKLNPFLSGSINFLAGRIIFVWESLSRVYFTFYHLFISASCLPFLSIPLNLYRVSPKTVAKDIFRAMLWDQFFGQTVQDAQSWHTLYYRSVLDLKSVRDLVKYYFTEQVRKGGRPKSATPLSPIVFGGEYLHIPLFGSFPAFLFSFHPFLILRRHF